METRIVAVGEEFKQEVLGEGLFDRVRMAYRSFRGKRVELVWVKTIVYVDGEDLFVEEEYLDRNAVREIVRSLD